MKAPIVFVAGKSGGHILPCLYKAQQIQQTDQPLHAISTTQITDKKILTGHPAVDKHTTYTLWSLNRTKWWQLPIIIGQMVTIFIKTILQFLYKRPHIVISTGGFISLPVIIAARLLGISIQLYELNVVPGKANKLLSHLVSEIHICFKTSKLYFKHCKTTFSPYPLRSFKKIDENQKKELFKKYGLQLRQPTLLILGGSQGAQSLNDTLPALFAPHKNLNIIHQIGNNNIKEVQKHYTNHGLSAYLCTFSKEIDELYTLADFVICRAGAGTLFEAAYCKKRTLIIPLITQQNNHQLFNAKAFVTEHADLFSYCIQSDLNQNAIDTFLQSYASGNATT